MVALDCNDKQVTVDGPSGWLCMLARLRVVCCMFVVRILVNIIINNNYGEEEEEELIKKKNVVHIKHRT